VKGVAERQPFLVDVKQKNKLFVLLLFHNINYQAKNNSENAKMNI
jgi:hypothetical protein